MDSILSMLRGSIGLAVESTSGRLSQASQDEPQASQGLKTVVDCDGSEKMLMDDYPGIGNGEASGAVTDAVGDEEPVTQHADDDSSTLRYSRKGTQTFSISRRPPKDYIDAKGPAESNGTKFTVIGDFFFGEGKQPIGNECPSDVYIDETAGTIHVCILDEEYQPCWQQLSQVQQTIAHPYFTDWFLSTQASFGVQWASSNAIGITRGRKKFSPSIANAIHKAKDQLLDTTKSARLPSKQHKTSAKRYRTSDDQSIPAKRTRGVVDNPGPSFARDSPPPALPTPDPLAKPTRGVVDNPSFARDSTPPALPTPDPPAKPTRGVVDNPSFARDSPPPALRTPDSANGWSLPCLPERLRINPMAWLRRKGIEFPSWAPTITWASGVVTVIPWSKQDGTEVVRNYYYICRHSLLTAC